MEWSMKDSREVVPCRLRSIVFLKLIPKAYPYCVQFGNAGKHLRSTSSGKDHLEGDEEQGDAENPLQGNVGEFDGKLRPYQTS